MRLLARTVCGRGLFVATDNSLPRPAWGLFMFADEPRLWLWTIHIVWRCRASVATGARTKVLEKSRGNACLVLNMMRNTLPPILAQLVSPLLQLIGDCFNAGSMFNCSHFNLPGVVSTVWSFRQLHHGISGVGIDTFAKFF